MNIHGTLNILNAIKNISPKTKFYFAGSSEMFGKVKLSPQKEDTPFYPRSPYGVSKVTGFDLTRNFREAYGLFACSGILFNHESPRRGSEFVTRKITQSIAKIAEGKENVLVLGNIDSKRDWGFAGDYVEAMWLMLQQNTPDDFVISTGETHSVQEFIQYCFKFANIPHFEIKDLHNLSIEEADKIVKELKNKKDKIFIVQHPRFYRLAEVDILLGDSSKAKKILNWYPKTSFDSLVRQMVESDVLSSQV